MTKIPAQYVLLVVSIILCVGWVGVDPKPLTRPSSSLSAGQSGTYHQLSDNERKELVWMAKAANAAYNDGDIPLGYRPFTKKEWDACSAGCVALVYSENGYFNASGSGLRGRLLVHITSEQRVVLSLSGVDGLLDKDGVTSVAQNVYVPDQFVEALRVLNGVLAVKHRSQLWIVGHSLGGCLTTYLALHLSESKTDIKCATFNGLGLSRTALSAASSKAKILASSRMRNIYDKDDVVFNYLPGMHLGPCYSIDCPGGKFEVMRHHGMEGLLKRMVETRTKWAGL